ncbi:MAG: PfkB family carbohydrate kinase [Planctomycetota bacterium]|jgi:sugar/nucleoside kinase (ribokinase family)
MTLLVVGTIAFDDIQTPRGEVHSILGGSCVYFSCAASLFGPVRLVSVVGEDFPQEHLTSLEARSIDIGGVQRVPGKTFRWSGRYTGAMNEAETLDTQLNVFGDFHPEIPPAFVDSRFLFLANGSPETQRSVLDQIPDAGIKVADTMNFWINTAREGLDEVIRRVDLLLINEGEVRMLTGETNLVRGGEILLETGLKGVVVKKGEHGVLHVSTTGAVALPAFPTADVVDPTGAGDSFAGGFMGSLAAAGQVTPETVKRALAHAMVTASFTVEDFGLRRLEAVDRKALDERFERYASMLHFDGS